MRVLAVLLVGLALAGAGSGGPTRLRISVRAGPDAPWRVLTLRCDPARGTVPHPAEACGRLLAGGRALFAPTPPRVACSQIYGGSQQALVTGVVRGRRVWAKLSRVDGCAVARWERVAFLFSG